MNIVCIGMLLIDLICVNVWIKRGLVIGGFILIVILLRVY